MYSVWGKKVLLFSETKRATTFTKYSYSAPLRDPLIANWLSLCGLFYSDTESMVRCCSCFGGLTPVELVNRLQLTNDCVSFVDPARFFPHTTRACKFDRRSIYNNSSIEL